MPLTTGRLGERRRVGGTRGAIRTELRRARRSGDRRLAHALGGQLAVENIRRAELGDSNIGSADSDIRETRARRLLDRQLLQEKAALASQTDTSLPRDILDGRPTADTPSGRPGNAAPSDPFQTPRPTGDTPPRPTGDTSPRPTGGTPPPTAEPAGSPARPAGGESPAVAPAPDTGGPLDIVRPATATPEVREGRIGGLPAEEATDIARYRTERQNALETGAMFNFSRDNPAHRSLVARVGEEEAERLRSEDRQKFFDEFEERHGTDKLVEILSSRAERFREERTRREAEVAAPARDKALSDLDFLRARDASARLATKGRAGVIEYDPGTGPLSRVRARLSQVLPAAPRQGGFAAEGTPDRQRLIDARDARTGGFDQPLTGLGRGPITVPRGAAFSTGDNFSEGMRTAADAAPVPSGRRLGRSLRAAIAPATRTSEQTAERLRVLGELDAREIERRRALGRGLVGAAREARAAVSIPPRTEAETAERLRGLRTLEAREIERRRALGRGILDFGRGLLGQ